MFLRLCSRAPRIVIWSVGKGSLYSFSRVIANVPLAVATRRAAGRSTRHSVTAVRRPAWTTRPVALSFSPTFAAEMKLSFRSKLMERTTPGSMVRNARPMAESARALIMPPWTKPMELAMSSVGVISTTATPRSWETSEMPSQLQARDTTALLTALALRHRHTCRRRARDQAVAVVDDVGLADPGPQGLHPAGRLSHQQRPGSVPVLNTF